MVTMHQNCKNKNSGNRSFMNNSVGQSLERDKLDLIGKCAFPVTKSAIEKTLLNQSVSNFLRTLLTVQAYIRKTNGIVIAVKSFTGSSRKGASVL